MRLRPDCSQLLPPPPPSSVAMASLANVFYNSLVKRNSVYVTSIFAGAFAFGVGFDVAITSFWDNWNKGKQWKDIREKYIQNDSTAN
ncbi:ubiquinol-cytochrome C reductase [Sparassis latifolia]|uniref:Complex III subunit 9 n=1 Tax=Sparassis crispa TaxID=139825 RepID=A0A401GB70_9APHY|nr:Cytochrome b-c1 complex subunit 9 [Sparassis crispa]GBE79397.1 Cytochrome b-c1 complex subunit 9 [Sparassis crispa]